MKKNLKVTKLSKRDENWYIRLGLYEMDSYELEIGEDGLLLLSLLDGNTSLEDVKRIMTSIYKNTTDEDIFYLISELESFDIIENIDEYKNYEYNNPKMLYFSNFTGNSKDILDKVDKACLFIYGYNEISIELIRSLLEIGF